MFITYKEYDEHEGWDQPSINERLGQEPRSGFAPLAKRTVPPMRPRPFATGQPGSAGTDGTKTRFTSGINSEGEER